MQDYREYPEEVKSVMGNCVFVLDTPFDTDIDPCFSEAEQVYYTRLGMSNEFLRRPEQEEKMYEDMEGDGEDEDEDRIIEDLQKKMVVGEEEAEEKKEEEKGMGEEDEVMD